MKKIIIFIAILGGIWAWQNNKLTFLLPAATDANGNPSVWVFTVKNSNECPSCQGLVEYLKKRKVPFDEKSINIQNPGAENYKLWEKFGGKYLPLVVVGRNKSSVAPVKEVIGLLVNNFGTQYLSRLEKKYLKKHFYPDGTPKIVMYGASWCPYCKRLRERLNSENMDYIEIDVEKRSDQSILSETMGVYGFPTVWVGNSYVRPANIENIKVALKK